MEFAGAQFAAWRKKMGVTQRQLAEREGDFASAAASTSSKGEAGPAKACAPKLEERLGLPAGQIANWRYGFGVAYEANCDTWPYRRYCSGAGNGSAEHRNGGRDATGSR